MPGGPTNHLEQTFRNCIDDFNKASTVGDYHNFEQYLHPTDLILIQRVDDPGDFIRDYRTGIMTYLGTDEVPEFPQFDFGQPVQHKKEGANKKGNYVGNVTGEGTYWDTYVDYINKVAPIPVRYSLRFKNTRPDDPHGAGIWLLITADVAPI